MSDGAPILQVAVPSPLYQLFDYLAPPDTAPEHLRPGTRLRVPFGRRRVVGVLVGLARASGVPAKRLRRAEAVLDATPAIPPDILALARWAADYYHHPVGEAISAALPAALRRVHATGAGAPGYRLTEAGRAVDPDTLGRAPRQAAALRCLAGHPDGLARSALDAPDGVLRALRTKGWVERVTLPEPTAPPAPPPDASDAPGSVPTLSATQAAAVNAVRDSLGGFAAFLLQGVTGSGKTEVYMRLIETVLATGAQALVLVPEIGLTPQLVARFRRRLPGPVAVLHSGLGDAERLRAWQAAATGAAPVVLGTRSAVFTPLARPGLIVVDEEHDPSFKQQEGFRYSARDLAVIRARRHDVPVVLGSATPALESLHNARLNRYRVLHLPERAGGARPPRNRVLDVRGLPLEDGLSAPLIEAMGGHLSAGDQVLVFLNRRGYAPTLLCHDCGWVAACPRCDARLTLHHAGRLCCHHCGLTRPAAAACPECGSTDLRPVGQGTERVEQALARHFPDMPLARLDRDSTRRKGALEAVLERARRGEARLLLGTQMLAKGHHFPRATLVAVVDADGGLFGADFRASERMAQLITQVAGRAGRAERPGEMIIQTHHPEHPLLARLLRQGYPAFADAALAERREAALPPYTAMALVRSEAPGRAAPWAFLEAAAARADDARVTLWGPVPAPMERRAGRYRAQLLVQAARRRDLHGFLDAWVPVLAGLPEGRRVRWSLDVDPVDML